MTTFWRRRAALWAVPVLLLAIVAGLATALTVEHRSGSVNGRPVALNGAARTSTPAAAHSSAAAAPQPAAPKARAAATTSTHPNTAPAELVHVSALESDDQTYGVGMPIVLYLSPVPTDPKPFENAVQVTVNGQPAHGAWYWEQPTADEVNAHIVEAHYRLPGYWPADSKIHVNVPVGGLSAGKGLRYADRLTSLDYKIGDAHISLVNASTLRMQVTSNGHEVRNIPVSLGAAATPTFNGVKVVMQKGEDVPGTNTLRPNGTVLMNGPNYTNDPVQWSVRITRSGEYVHAAPWNHGIGEHSTSNGCTNLHVSDAQWFYGFSQLGDVVRYVGTDGTRMPSSDGLGDWNMPWAQWSQGGLLKT